MCAQEFQYAEQLSAGIGGVKPVSWSGIRAMISEVQCLDGTCSILCKLHIASGTV